MPKHQKNSSSNTEQDQQIEQHDSVTEERQKVTFYLSQEQILKLDNLVYIYNSKIRGKRINRNHIIRYLIDDCTIEILAQLRR